MTTPALLLDGVTLSFGRHPVLEDVSLVVEEGEFLGLIGPNGAGKTALLRVITGILTPDRGRVEVFGRAPQKARGRVGYVPQYARFEADYPIRVRDVVFMGRLAHRRLLRPWSAEDHVQVDEAMRRMEIESLAHREVGHLSGGQLQRVLIARALASQARLLVLDEPTASLDSQMDARFYEQLRSLAKDMTIILVSHDIGVLGQYVSSVACLNRRLHYHGSKDVDRAAIAATWGSDVDLLVHDHPHRIIGEHGEECL